MKASTVLYGVVAFAIVGMCLSGSSGGDRNSPNDYVSIKVIDRWASGAVVIASLGDHSESHYRGLSKALQLRFGDKRIALVDVYDDEAAALLREAAFADRLTKEREAFWNLHRIASYTKNVNTGVHELVVFPNGTGGAHSQAVTLRLPP